MRLCKQMLSASRKITRITFTRPKTIRSAAIRVFPTIFDTITHTHDIRTSIACVAEVEIALISFEVSLIAINIATKTVFKSK